MPKDQYFDSKSDKALLAKAKEAIAKEEAAGGSGARGGSGSVAGGLRKGASVGASMFQKPFWKSSQDLNEEKVGGVCGRGRRDRDVFFTLMLAIDTIQSLFVFKKRLVLLIANGT